MAQEYYNLERTAEFLKISPGEVNRMREQSQLRAFRDGSDWKFRKEDVEDALAKMLKDRNESNAPQEDDDFLSFGNNEDEDLPTMMADTVAPEQSSLSDDEDSALDFDGLDLVDEVDDGLSLVESDSGPAEPGPAQTLGEEDSGTYKVDLAGEPGPSLEEDDDMVLGGSSDLSLSSDSGISLAEEDGNDYAIAQADDDALETDEDSDILALADTEEDSDVATLLAGDDGKGNDFELEADPNEFEDSDSSSQVIMVDSPFDEISEGEFGSGGFSEPSGFETTSPVADTTQQVFGGQDYTSQPIQPTGKTVSPYEPNYTGLSVTAMALCILLLGFAGMMMFDLVRNMGSWGNSYVLSSPIMETIAGLVGLR